MGHHLLKLKVAIWLGVFVLCSLWPPATASYGSQPVVPTTMWSLAWHPNGTALAAGVNLNGKTGVRLFDFTTDRSTWIETSGNVLALSWSPDGTMLAACISSSPGYRYLVWDATTLAQVLAVEQETDPATLLIIWSPDSTQIAFPGILNVSIWDVNSVRQVANLMEYTNYTESIEIIAWHPDSTRFVVAQNPHIIRIWDIVSQRVVQEYEIRDTAIQSLVLSPDGERFALGSDKGNVVVFSTATGDLLDSFQVHGLATGVFFLEWSPLGDQIAATGFDGPIAIWNLSDRRTEAIITFDSLDFEVMRFSPYGGRLAYGGQLSGHASAALLSGNEQSLLDGAARIIVPDPSLERLATIQAACAESDGAIIGIAVPQREAALDEYIAQVEAVPAGQLPPGCAADLVAVAHALQSQ